MPLLDAFWLDNSGPSHVARVHDRESEYRERPEVKARYARQHREWVEKNREHLKAYRREYSQRPEVREKALRYGRGYRQRPEVIEVLRRGKAFTSGRSTEAWTTMSLDEIREGGGWRTPGGDQTGYDFHGSVADDPLRLLLDQSSEARAILAGVVEDDIDHMDDHELGRLRERLMEAGLTPSTQREERARQRHLQTGRDTSWRN